MKNLLFKTLLLLSIITSNSFAASVMNPSMPVATLDGGCKVSITEYAPQLSNSLIKLRCNETNDSPYSSSSKAITLKQSLTIDLSTYNIKLGTNGESGWLSDKNIKFYINNKSKENYTLTLTY